MSIVRLGFLLATLLAAPLLPAAPQEGLSLLGSSTGSAPAPAAPAAANAEGFLRLAVQRGESPHDNEPLTPELYARLSPDWRARADQFRRDPLIGDLVRRVATAWPSRPQPVLVVISGSARGAYFNHSFVVMDAGPLAPGADMKAVALSRRNTMLHELAHFLQFRLYGQWLPDVNYRSTEFVGTDSDSHQFDKVTNESTAWCEGFAEATAAFLGSDSRIEEFSHRKLLYLGVADRPRASGQLERIEGWVASALHDFWLPKGSTKAFQRSLDVIRLAEGPRNKAEQHESFRAYLSEHLTRFPADAPRWEAVVRANTLLAEGASYGTLPADVHGQVQALGTGLQRLGQSYPAQYVARAIWLALKDAGDGAPSLGRVEALARQLAGTGAPVFVTPDSGGEKYETMPLAQLKLEVERARQEFEGQMQTIGYDFHPRVKECKERWQKLQALYARRGGR